MNGSKIKGLAGLMGIYVLAGAAGTVGAWLARKAINNAYTAKERKKQSAKYKNGVIRFHTKG